MTGIGVWAVIILRCVLSLSDEPSSGNADMPDTITLRGETYNVWPFEDLNRRGFDIRTLPRKENAAWTYIQAENAYSELPEALKEPFKYAWKTDWPAGKDELATYVSRPENRRALELATRASRMESCQMPSLGDPSGSVFGVLLPHLSPLRFLAKLTAVDGRRLESIGQTDAALERYLTCLRIGSHVGQGFTLIDGLVGLAVWSSGQVPIRDAVLRDKLTLDQLTFLEAEISGLVDRSPTIEAGLEGERSFGPAVVDELCSRPLALLLNMQSFNLVDMGPLVGTSELNANPSSGWGRLELRIGQLILPDRAVKRHMLGYYDGVLAMAKGRAGRALDLGFDEEQYIKEEIPKWDVLSRILLPSLSRAVALGHRLQADIALLRTSIAIRIHMLKNDGVAPVSLDSLSDQISSEAMQDPFGVDMLRYRVTTDGYLLYSVGLNGTDNGGKQGKKWHELDIVHQFPSATVKPFEMKGGRP